MHKINRVLAAAVLATGIVGGTYAFLGSPLMPAAEAHWKDHPKLQAANEGLRDAKEYLEHAPHDFHGHRAEAIRAIDAALHQLAVCAEEDERRGSLAPLPLDEHPRLHKAHENLKAAREYLREAPHNFRGHRDEAIRAIDEAIHQIELCMA